MNSVIASHPEYLKLLWAVPLAALCFYYAARKRRAALGAFASTTMTRHLLAPELPVRRGWKSVALCLALAMLVTALAGPAWNPSPAALQREGRDIVFLLDVSRSMLARDIAPNRLARAKAAIADCLEHLAGDRVALVVFAGGAVIQCPLTMDYAFFKMRLDEANTTLAPVGGTQLAVALETIIETVLLEEREGRQDIVLITDGEDHDSNPAAAARALEDAGARLIAIGIGDDQRGARVPIRDEESGLERFLTHEGAEVWSRLDATTLRATINATRDGMYLHAATGSIDLPGVYRQVIQSAQESAFEEQILLRYEAKFQVFLLFALVLLLLAAGTRDVRPVKRRGRRIWGGTATGLLLIALLPTPMATGESVDELLRDGNRAYRDGDYATAAKQYDAALGLGPDTALLHYNLGNTRYRQQDYEAAIEAYETTLYFDASSALAGQSLHNLGNCAYKLGELQREVSLESAAEFCRMSARYFRAALDTAAPPPDAAANLEIARRTAAALDAEIAAAEEARRQLEEALAKIKTTLEELIERQEDAEENTQRMGFADSAPENRSIADAIEEQRPLRDDTRALHTEMEKVNFLFAALGDVPDDAPLDLRAPLTKSMGHVADAIAAQESALESFAVPSLLAARTAQHDAVVALRKALETLPQAPKTESDDGEPSDAEPDEDAEHEESEAEGEEQAEEVDPAEPPEDGEFTAPKEAPEDILEEEQRNNMERQQRRPDHYVPVEKDW